MIPIPSLMLGHHSAAIADGADLTRPTAPSAEHVFVSFPLICYLFPTLRPYCCLTSIFIDVITHAPSWTFMLSIRYIVACTLILLLSRITIVLPYIYYPCALIRTLLLSCRHRTAPLPPPVILLLLSYSMAWKGWTVDVYQSELYSPAQDLYDHDEEVIRSEGPTGYMEQSTVGLGGFT